MLISFKAIGRNIRTARMDMNLTQEDVAERLKISQLHFGRLERGPSRFAGDARADCRHSRNAAFRASERLCGQRPIRPQTGGCAGIARALHRGYRKRLFSAGSAANAGALQDRRAER